jgi:HSP20 family protein
MQGPDGFLDWFSRPPGEAASGRHPFHHQEFRMTALTRMERFDDLFPELFRRMARPFSMAPDMPGDIRIDITEKDKEYQVRAEIPGAKKEDIRLTVDGNFVSIAAEVRREKEEKNGRNLVRETSFGSVSRGFALAHEIDSQAVVAKLEDGVLNLTLPKRGGAGTRQIAIQ